jgi:dethiobiotin synthetase
MSNGSYPHTIFVLGTHRDVGKTVTCMGIIAKLLSPEYGHTLDDIGYIKPVGQQTLTVLNGEGLPIEADKDAVVLTSLMGVACCGYEKTSPVIWRGGLTASFIEDRAHDDPWAGRQEFMRTIREAYQFVAQGKRIVIVEGTGQPGVGSVAGISNADVINMLREIGAPVFVVFVTRAGIGSTIDEIFPYLMALDHMGTRVDGIIINGVLVDKLDKIRHYLDTYYTHLFEPLYGNRLLNQPTPPILGYVPKIPELSMPTMRLIAENFSTDRHSGLDIVSKDNFEENAISLVHDLKVINLRYGYERFVEPGDAVVAGFNANDSLMSVVMHHQRLLSQHGQGLSGLILSCKSVGGLSRQVANEILGVDNLATLAVDYDTAEIIQQVSSMSVKIQPYDVAKKALIEKVYREHLTLWQDFLVTG